MKVQQIIIILFLLFTSILSKSQDLIFILEGHVYDYVEEGENARPLGNVKLHVLGTDGSVQESLTDVTGYYEFETDSSGARLIKANCSYTVVVSAMDEPASDGNKYLESKGQETTIGMTESTVFIKDFALVCADCNVCGGLIPRLPFTDCNTLIENDSINVLDSLDFIVQILKENPTIELEIIGRCDQFMKTEQKEECSQQRANLVKDYFVRKGTNPLRLNATISLSEYPFLTATEFQNLRSYHQKMLKKRSNEVLLRVTSFDFEPNPK
jgi:hypothetical protein